ncbi:MAG: phosphoadenylyl-sulfate reductase [Planctomycetota bacterium]
MSLRNKEYAAQLNEKWSGLSAEDVLISAAELLGDKVVFASSMGLEDQVITDMIARHKLDIEIFTIDTGRLFNETYDLIEQTEEKYSIKINIHFPRSGEVENMVNAHGVNLFLKSVENRRKCCFVRKVLSLRRALAGKGAWVCGLRSGQAATRSHVDIVEWDEGNYLIKINPLALWSEDVVRNYLKVNDVPYNPLHDKGFPSIGCACCTRAIKEGEDIRAGRWWWEEPEKKECGLHNNKNYQKNDYKI